MEINKSTHVNSTVSQRLSRFRSAADNRLLALFTFCKKLHELVLESNLHIFIEHSVKAADVFLFLPNIQAIHRWLATSEIDENVIVHSKKYCITRNLQTNYAVFLD